MNNNKLKEIKRYWENGNLYAISYMDENDMYQGIYKICCFDGKVEYVEYCIDDRPEGEIIKYEY